METYREENKRYQIAPEAFTTKPLLPEERLWRSVMINAPEDTQITHLDRKSSIIKLKAQTFDPFTHVYIIDVDFPPDLWEKLATMWNHSNLRLCQYLICYAAPKYLAEYVFFAVKLVAQTNTLMHGFLKIHMVYVYRCTQNHILCNPLFKSSYNLVKGGLKGLKNIVDQQVKKEMNEQSPLTR